MRKAVLFLAGVLFGLGVSVRADGGLSLVDCLAIAKNRQPALKAASWTIEQSRQLLVAARSAYYPKLGYAASAQTTGSRDVDTHMMNRGSQLSPVSLSSNFTLYDFGRREGGIGGSKKGVELAEQSRVQVEAAVILNVKQAYFETLRAQETLKMVDKSVAEREKILSLIRKLYDRGARSLFDVSRAETDVEAARLQRLSVETQLRSQQKSLLAAMGTPEDPWQGLSDALSAKIVRVSRDSAIRLALEDRPEVRGEKALVSINENLAKIARAGHLPSIGLTGAYSLDRFSNNGFVSRSNSWSGAVTASLDIFSGFSVQAGYNKAMAALKTEQENLKARQQSVILDVESDMIALEQSAARIEIAKTLHDRARKSEGLAKAEYEGGRGSLLDLISAQDSLLNAETGLIDALADHHEAQARIEQAVGAPLSEFVKE